MSRGEEGGLVLGSGVGFHFRFSDGSMSYFRQEENETLSKLKNIAWKMADGGTRYEWEQETFFSGHVELVGLVWEFLVRRHLLSFLAL